MDYYDRLGVSRSATLSEIRTAWKRMSLKHHPDKNNGDDTICKHINQAYSVLADEQKRRTYDRFGEEGINGNNNGYMPSGFSFFGGPPNQQEQQSSVIVVDISLEEVCTGTTKSLKIPRWVNDKNILTPCMICRGSGMREVIQQSRMGLVQTRIPCTACSGSGHSGRKQVISVETVTIIKGCPEGLRFVLDDDIIIQVRYIKHKTFQVRKGTLDLQCTVRLNLYEALLGFERELTHPDGRLCRLVVTNVVTKPGLYSMVGYGITLPIERAVGNLLVVIEVDFPNKFDATLLVQPKNECSENTCGKRYEDQPAPSYLTTPFIEKHNRTSDTPRQQQQQQQCRQQ